MIDLSRAIPLHKASKAHFEMQEPEIYSEDPAGFICTLKGEIPQQVSHKRWSSIAFSRLAGKKILVGFTHVNISGPTEETRALDLRSYSDTVIF